MDLCTNRSRAVEERGGHQRLRRYLHLASSATTEIPQLQPSKGVVICMDGMSEMARKAGPSFVCILLISFPLLSLHNGLLLLQGTSLPIHIPSVALLRP